MLSVHLGKYQGTQLLDHMLRVFLVFNSLPNSLSKWLENAVRQEKEIKCMPVGKKERVFVHR